VTVTQLKRFWGANSL